MGNQTLYAVQLRMFAQAQAKFETLFLQAQRDGDDAGAQRLAHTLKGHAGTIGALQLEREAAALEELCGSVHLKALQAQLLVTVNTLQQILGQLEIFTTKATDAFVPPDNNLSLNSNVKLELQRLQQLVNNADPQAIEFLDGLLTKSMPGAVREVLERAAKALNVYEFEQASAVLAQAVER